MGCAWLSVDLDIGAARSTVERDGSGSLAFSMDVSKRHSVKDVCRDRKAFGGYDILVANAGVSTMNRAVDLTDEEWDFNFAVNTKGVFLTNQAAARIS